MTMPRPFRRGPGRRRAIDKLRRLEEQLAACQADVARLRQWKQCADDYFARLIIDRHDVFQAWEEAVMRATEAEIVASCTQMDCLQLADDKRELERRLAALMNSDTRETEVRSLRERFELGPVRALQHSPQASRPEHIPAWHAPGAPA